MYFSRDRKIPFCRCLENWLPANQDQKCCDSVWQNYRCDNATLGAPGAAGNGAGRLLQKWSKSHRPARIETNLN